MTPSTSQPGVAHAPYSVSRLNREVRAVIEGSFPLIWVEGEISNLARPRSGHIYFTLKDEFAQVRCAMFKMKAAYLRLQPRDGMQVKIRARVSLYEPRGDFQLIAEQMEEAGHGLLQRRFDALKARLDSEGLFAAERKRPLPLPPRRLGVVTSPSGAAIHDILTVLKRRFPALPVVIYPTAVQGEGAAQQIAEAIAVANRRAECDLLIVGRGGGSLEDLWAFNEEVVARAIAASRLPILSAVGHEVDISIADLVADQRAPTPSAAAELISPDTEAWRDRLALQQRLLARAVSRQIQGLGQRLDHLRSRMRHPRQRLQAHAQRLDELELRLQQQLRQRIGRKGMELHALKLRLANSSPQRCHALLSERLGQLARRLERAERQQRTALGQRLAALAHSLHTVSPLATLGRGYAILQNSEGAVIRAAGQVAEGERLHARLATGALICQVEKRIDDE